VKLGILVETEEGLDWDHWRKTFRAAERLGFESVWISDHLQSAWSAGRHGLEPWTALAIAAAETRRVILGALVSPITFREPTLVARMAESIDDLSPGRFVIGLGLGWNAEEHAAAGIHFPPVAQRSARLANGIECIRRELGERRVPILIGGKGARSTLPVVARLADEWNITTSSPTEYASAAADLDRLCRQIGRDPAHIRRSVALGFVIGREARELDERSERLRRIVPPLGAAQDALAAAREMGWMVGTSAEVVDGLRALGAAGVERVMLGHYEVDHPGSLELLAREVMPAVV
jgi:alkanesulfonate monooxygenase SsuD/methylene tetrahydromethanopterin reductase-like flavin-dependent oxidoreductase (luciferase family)